jgi:hypothetical protein
MNARSHVQGRMPLWWRSTPLRVLLAVIVAACAWPAVDSLMFAQGDAPASSPDVEPAPAEGSTDAENSGGESDREGTDGPRQREVEAAVRHYFDSWSTRKMDDYGRCFHAQGVIQMRDARGDVQTFLKTPFVEWQRQVVRQATEPMVETPEEITIEFEQEIARVEVLWKLRARDRIDFGYDHFTLLKEDGRWQILHLLFYSIPDPN